MRYKRVTLFWGGKHGLVSYFPVTNQSSHSWDVIVVEIQKEIDCILRGSYQGGADGGNSRGRKKASITECLGYALGCVGMSYADFCRCGIDEFDAIAKAYQDERNSWDKEEWERMRVLAAYRIQPHVTRRITPHELIPLPWDKHDDAPIGKDRRVMMKEERKKRFEEVRDMIDRGGANTTAKGGPMVRP